MTLLAELRDAYAHTGRDTDFRQRLTRLREGNQRRPGLIHRLDRHGLRQVPTSLASVHGSGHGLPGRVGWNRGPG